VGSKGARTRQGGRYTHLLALSNLDWNVIMMRRPRIITLSLWAKRSLWCLWRPYAKFTKDLWMHPVAWPIIPSSSNHIQPWANRGKQENTQDIPREIRRFENCQKSFEWLITDNPATQVGGYVRPSSSIFHCFMLDMLFGFSIMFKLTCRNWWLSMSGSELQVRKNSNFHENHSCHKWMHLLISRSSPAINIYI
jgi:hypothetical protein